MSAIRAIRFFRDLLDIELSGASPGDALVVDTDGETIVAGTASGGSPAVLPSSDESDSQPTEGTMKTWATTDAINGNVVHFRAKGVYASLEDSLGRLGYVAREIGVVGNTITVEYVDAGGTEDPLVVTVVGNAISVQLETAGDAVAATLTTDLGGDADLTFTAKTPGAAGNAITVGYVAPAVDSAVTAASVDGNEIAVDLAGTADTYAYVDTALGGNKDVRFYAAPGLYPGAAGNALDARLVYNYVDGGATVFQCYINGTVVRIMNPVGQGLTANDLVAWATTNPEFTNWAGHYLGDYLTVETAPGSNGSGVLGDTVDTGVLDMANGADGAISATADDVLAAVEADAGSDALVAVSLPSGSDGSGIVSPGVWELGGGADGGVVTTASQAKAALDNNSAAAALVAVSVFSDQQMAAMAEESLAGGNNTTITEWSVN